MTDKDASPKPEPAETPAENEVLRETRHLSELRRKAEKAAKSVNWTKAAAAGIGSAALVAAALYASRKKD